MDLDEKEMLTKDLFGAFLKRAAITGEGLPKFVWDYQRGADHCLFETTERRDLG